jgi:integrase
VGVLGKDRPAETLRPADFMRVLARLKADYGASTRAAYVTATRTVFTWASSVELIRHPLNFGGDFHGTTGKKIVRRQRREGRKKFIEADVVRALIAAANPQVRAMIRLGLNAGFYAIDCSDLRTSDVDLDNGILRMERHKTEIDRLAVLWPETIADLRQAIATRPEPADPSHADRLFITKRGQLWVKTQNANYDEQGRIKSVTHNDYIGQEFVRLFEKAGVDRPEGCTFAWLRHTFYTVARRTGMADAVNAVMGHAGGGMVEHYLEEVDHAGVETVCAFVRGWLMDEGKAVIGRIG